MPTPHKAETVRELAERFTSCTALLLAEFRGLKVEEMKELRRALAAAGTQFKVVKNTLTRIAARETKVQGIIPLLEGSTAIAFVEGDPVAAAKVMDEMSKKYPALVVKGAILDQAILGAQEAQALAKVRPREELMAQLAGLLRSPMQKVAMALSAPLRSLGYALGAYRDKLGGPGGERPAI